MSDKAQPSPQTSPDSPKTGGRTSAWMAMGVALVMLLILGGLLLAAREPVAAPHTPPAATQAAIPAPSPSQPTATPPANPGQGATAPKTGTKVGQLAPDFELETLDGATTLYEHRGQAVLINFWASWCVPCRKEFPDIQEAYETYASQGLQVLAVNVGDSADVAAQFADEFELDFPVLLDTRAGVARLYGISGIPTSYFLDEEGVIRQVIVGSMTKSYLENALQKLMGEG